jgi:pyruvate dehydrogenase E2 component (dihydrolipoamide acetyltransferase)
MTVKQFKLPDPGEGLTEAEVVTWHVKVGDTVEVNDIVVEIETAKSLVELPVPFAGTVTELLVSEGETVEVGTPIISVEDGRGADVAPSGPAAQPATAPAGTAPADGASGDAPQIEEGKIGGTTSTGRTAVLVGYGVKQTEARRRPRKGVQASPGAGMPSDSDTLAATDALPVKNPVEFVPSSSVGVDDYTERTPRAPVETPARPTGAGRALAKPPVRKYAKDLGVDLDEVQASGDGGVITRADVDAHRAGASVPGTPRPSPDGLEEETPTAGPGWFGHEAEYGIESRLPVKGVRKMTAAAMVKSAFTAPHVTEWVTIDVTRTMELVARLKQDREFADVKVTPLLLLAKALCIAIARNPGMNATWDEHAQEIIVKRYVNLGIAAATPRGLLVPNVKHAERLNLLQLAQAIGQLTATAREGRTQPADMAGGTMTITNVGVFGVDSGTPIINPGESAIVCFGAIRKQPWVVTDADGNDELAIRHVTQLSVSFDHRLIDGQLGSRFLSDVAAILEDPSRGIVWG